jgi:hypothetical protein
MNRTGTTTHSAPLPVVTAQPDGPVTCDAHEYGAHVRSGGARLGLLVARSVQSASRGRPVKGATALFTKVTATQFAAMSGCDKNLILRHLHAWDLYVDANRDDPRGLPGLLFSHELVPGQEIDIDADALPVHLRFETFYSGQVRLANPHASTPIDADVAGRTQLEPRLHAESHRGAELDPYRNVPGAVQPARQPASAPTAFDVIELEVRAAAEAAQSAWTFWNELIGDNTQDQVPGDGRRPPGTFDTWRRDTLAMMASMMQQWADLGRAMELYGSPPGIDLRDARPASAHG